MLISRGCRSDRRALVHRLQRGGRHHGWRLPTATAPACSSQLVACSSLIVLSCCLLGFGRPGCSNLLVRLASRILLAHSLDSDSVLAIAAIHVMHVSQTRDTFVLRRLYWPRDSPGRGADIGVFVDTARAVISSKRTCRHVVRTQRACMGIWWPLGIYPKVPLWDCIAWRFLVNRLLGTRPGLCQHVSMSTRPFAQTEASTNRLPRALLPRPS